MIFFSTVLRALVLQTHNVLKQFRDDFSNRKVVMVFN